MTDWAAVASPAFLAGHLLLTEIILLLALVMALSGLDDLLIDIVFIVRLVGRQPRTPTLAALRQVPPAPLAVIVPAWDEAAVIGAMLDRLLRDMDYPAFQVFVGLYPNDPAGLAAVTRIADARLTPIVCRSPGPTTKADCLNHLWRAVLAHERRHGIRFKAVVLHDAEDVVHPPGAARSQRPDSGAGDGATAGGAAARPGITLGCRPLSR